MKFKNIRGYSNGKIKFKNIQDFRRPVRTLVTTDYLVFTCVHSFLYFPVFPGISHLGVLDRSYHWTGRYFLGITVVFPVYISQPMFTLVLVLGVSVLDVLEYLIGENAKYLYLITST